MSRFLCAAAFLVLIATAIRADDPAKKIEPEKIPAPKAKAEPSIIIEPYMPRSDTREVWQHYGVNRLGRFVPRVIVYPEGAYYSRNLQPYPWAGNRPTAVLPMKVD
jgi:hypothetical protein